ncbi:MAG TPA: helix-turn-helix domain-containing protein [Actinomycetales bacterium]|nr:helix-turn-helix domain-containing protein [Actinomycetales bacterium]
MTDDFASQVAGVGALAEPARRSLYLYVVSQPDPVSRDQAAAGADLPRHTAKFHLDKLVEEGLLDTEFRRLTGRRGPGAGRPAKLYRRSDRQLAVTLPRRHYELAGEILAEAIDSTTGRDEPVLDAVTRAARAAGRRLGAESRAGAAAQGATAALASYGYEPRAETDRVVLANCPFHALSRTHTELVCTMNHALIDALVSDLGDDLQVRLDPGPNRCCVTLAPAPPSAPDVHGS